MPVSIVVVIGLVLLSILVGLDVYFATDKVPHNTWSEIIRHWAKHAPLVPYICGVLSGHFFHPNTKSILGQPHSIALLIWTACFIGVVGLGLYHNGISPPLWLVFLLGCVAGALLWPV